VPLAHPPKGGQGGSDQLQPPLGVRAGVKGVDPALPRKGRKGPKVEAFLKMEGGLHAVRRDGPREGSEAGQGGRPPSLARLGGSEPSQDGKSLVGGRGWPTCEGSEACEACEAADPSDPRFFEREVARGARQSTGTQQVSRVAPAWQPSTQRRRGLRARRLGHVARAVEVRLHACPRTHTTHAYAVHFACIS
jgi:hypothetical protein